MFKRTRSNSKKDICGTNQLDFPVSSVNWKTVILQTTNIAKIYFSFTSSTEELKVAWKPWSRLSGFPARLRKWDIISKYGHESTGRVLTGSGSLSSFCQTTADSLIEHQQLTLPLRPWKICLPFMLDHHCEETVKKRSQSSRQAGGRGWRL